MHGSILVPNKGLKGQLSEAIDECRYPGSRHRYRCRKPQKMQMRTLTLKWGHRGRDYIEQLWKGRVEDLQTTRIIIVHVDNSTTNLPGHVEEGNA